MGRQSAVPPHGGGCGTRLLNYTCSKHSVAPGAAKGGGTFVVISLILPRRREVEFKKI